MFAYQGGDLPRLSTHADALRFYEQAKTWRGETRDTDERKLDGSKRHTTIRKLADGSIACKLHRTDVITYHPDNTITVVPWGSRSTDEFFNALVRNVYGLQSSFTSGVIQVGDRFYRAVDTVLIRLNPLEMVTQTEPFKFATINRKRAKAARDLYDYSSFSAYANMSEKMGMAPVPPRERMPVHNNPEVLLDALQNREYWPHLLVPAERKAYQATHVSAALTLTDVRNAIYTVHRDVYDRTEEPFFESWRDIERWKRN